MDKNLFKNLRVIPYQAEYGEQFRNLNLKWLKEHFEIEEYDYEVLNNPQSAILNAGGHILLLEYDAHIIGTVALKHLDKETFELNKMTVDESYRGIGAGKLLCHSAIMLAKYKGAKKIVLYSVTSLENAISIYRKLGFEEIPLERGSYKRANIKMQLNLENILL